MKISRQKFIQNIFRFSSVFLGIVFIGGCGREGEESGLKGNDSERISFGDSCDDLSNVSQSEIGIREISGYVEETPYPQNRCDNCQMYIPPAENEECGGCVLFKGPIFPGGYCDHWAPKT